MIFSVVDPSDFLNDGMFREDDFLAKVDSHDWTTYTDKKVLVRGCSSGIIPPWAFMYLTGLLAGRASSVRYGNEHDHIVVYRKPR